MKRYHLFLPLLLPREVRERRQALKLHFDVAKEFKMIEESCVPSYLHNNYLAAWVSWMRLLQAVHLYEKWAPEGDVLDFGSGTGELEHFLNKGKNYHFIEQSELLVDALKGWLPNARRSDIADLDERKYAAVFALDSLEHNEEIEPLISKLKAKLIASGVLIVSGPTENLLYRMGRRIAGYQGDYHLQTISDIEALVSCHMSLIDHKLVPMGLPLFSVSAWRIN